MPRGSSSKREREYTELVGEFKKEHRYPGREKEVAARIVNKQRRELGESKNAQPPLRGYDRMTVTELRSKIAKLSDDDKRKLANYEKNHKNRKTVLAMVG